MALKEARVSGNSDSLVKFFLVMDPYPEGAFALRVVSQSSKLPIHEPFHEGEIDPDYESGDWLVNVESFE